MDYGNRLVVVTGGTGALGRAVVGALLEVGAVCHVPYRSKSEAIGYVAGSMITHHLVCEVCIETHAWTLSC